MSRSRLSPRYLVALLCLHVVPRISAAADLFPSALGLRAAVPLYAAGLPKMNVSQDEYENKFQEYERRLRETRSVDEMTTFHSLRHSDQSRRLLLDFGWSKNITKDISLTLESRLRVFIEGSNDAELEIRKNGKLTELRHLDYLPRWIDVQSGTEWWNFELKCRDCVISQPAVVVHNKAFSRKKRYSERIGRTDCKFSRRQRTCCRHPMQVVFKDLPGYDYIQQPFSFDAGYCKGGCPYRFNHANEHANIQNLIRKLNKDDAPKLCCAPTKLEPLQIIYLDANDHTKLKVDTWKDMKVIECACL